MPLKKPKENKWMKAMELLKHSKLVGDKPELNKEQEKKLLMEMINSGIYRTKYKTQKLRANTLKNAGGLMDKGSYFFMKGEATKSFDKIKVISDPTKSASDSVVIVLVKGRQQFVMKLTFVESARSVEYNAPDTEARFYKIMETLVKKNITPHVFMLTDCLWESIPRNQVEPNFQTFLKKYNTSKDYVYPIMTETGNSDSELITLADLLKELKTKYNYINPIKAKEASQIILNIMFQVIYTIHCFVKIDFKHNDLHIGNIFILKRKANVLDNPKLSEQFKRKYKFDLPDGTIKTVLLENIGLDVRIFDFDRSVKAKNNFRYHPEGLKSRFLREFNFCGQNAVNNPHADLFKISCHLRIGNKVPRQIKDIIDTFFIQKSLLLRNEYYTPQGKRVKVLKRGYEDFYLLDKKLPDGVLMRCNEALNVLATHVDATIVTKMKNKMVLETFSTENIGESEKERVMRIIKERDAEKAKKAAASKKVPIIFTATEPLPAPSAPPKKSKKQSVKAGAPLTLLEQTDYIDRMKERAAEKAKKAAASKKVSFKVKKATAIEHLPAPSAPPKKSKKQSVKASKSATKETKTEKVICDDKKTKRSSIKTKNTNFEGKKRNRKMMDPRLKNCMLPFKFKRQMHNKCFDDGDGAICATERKPNCSIEKYAYCQ